MDQSQCAFVQLLSEQLDGSMLILQLAPEIRLELVPPLWIGILAEPQMHFLARGYFFQPKIDRGVLVVQVARPKPLHQDSVAVFRQGFS